MTWDLGKAMRKKEEFESARLMDFEYRQRARAMRLLAEAFGGDPGTLARETALDDDQAILALLSEEISQPLDRVIAEHRRCWEEARRQLIAERGDPTPYRLG